MFIPENIKTLDKGFDTFIQNGYSRRNLFDDWLNMIIYSFGMKKYEAEYLDVVKKYKKDELDKFAEMFGWLVKHLDENQFTDPLGDYFQHCITRGEHGQFFTPTHICNVMAEVSNPKGQETAIDPCCGSGRMLLASIKVCRKNNLDPYCFGADLDNTCAKMCAINLFMYGIQGEVACMNSLTNDFFFAYKLTNPFQGGLTIIKEKEESVIWKSMNNRLEEKRLEMKKSSTPTQKPLILAEKPMEEKMVKMFQDSLF